MTRWNAHVFNLNNKTAFLKRWHCWAFKSSRWIQGLQNAQILTLFQLMIINSILEAKSKIDQTIIYNSSKNHSKQFFFFKQLFKQPFHNNNMIHLTLFMGPPAMINKKIWKELFWICLPDYFSLDASNISRPCWNPALVACCDDVSRLRRLRTLFENCNN